MRRTWESHQFKNHGSDYLCTHDARCAVIGPYRLGTVATTHRQPLCTLQHDALIWYGHLSNGRGGLPLQ
jgi:hypothetical protein